MRQNFTVKAILRTDKKRKDKTCPINYRVTIDKKTIKLPSGEFTEENNWNASAGLIKGSKSSITNSLLDSDVARIKDFLREQRSLGNTLSTDMVKNYFSKTSTDDFATVFDEFSKRKFSEIKESTQKHYLFIRKSVIEFKPNLKVQDIDTKFIEQLDEFIRKTSKRGVSDTGMFNRHKNMKTFVLYLLKNKLLTTNPYDDFKAPKCRQKFGHITTIELEAIRELDLSNCTNQNGLALTIDMFLFACYTGLRYSDVRNLKWANVINMQYLNLETQKTSKEGNIPLTRLAKKILMRYKVYRTENVFPSRTNECLNRNLKVIATMCEIKKVVTFHMGRHTFATILANANVNPFHIAQLMTHSNMKQTMTYVNSSVTALGKSLENIKAFN
ncbi:Phage integrase domain containing protein [Flavobacterium daejeonense]|nr:Phage integrase domain containing protein [Flavobacterium daejeonense]